jgi:hypothetical protein
MSIVNRDLLDESLLRIRREFPDAVAVFLVGSWVRGEAGPFGDIGLDVLVASGPPEEYPSWFVVGTSGRVHVSLWVRDLPRWLGGEPQEWAFGLPCVDRLQWRDQLAGADIAHPAGEPQLDHFLREVARMARYRGDDLALRLAAQDLAHPCPSQLYPLNRVAPVESRYAVLRAALPVDVAVPGFRADPLACLGLVDGPATSTSTSPAVQRLSTGVAWMLAAHARPVCGRAAARPPRARPRRNPVALCQRDVR